MDFGKKDCFYAVRKGRKPGIYTNWDDCARQVLGSKNNEHKSFYSLEEAKEYMRGGDCSRKRGSSQPLLQDPSYASPLSQHVSELYLSSGSGMHGNGSGGTETLSDHEISTTEVKDFIYEEDMELMLMRVCSSLRIGVPMFVPQDMKSMDGQPMFGFTVFLPHNLRGVELVAHGPTSEERFARQEVSFTMLEKLLTNTRYGIYDYNYRKVVQMQQHIRQQISDNDGLTERIRQLEEENAELRSQVQLIEDMLDGY